MEKPPNTLDRIMPEIINKFGDMLEERFTTPNNIDDISSNDISMVREGKKIPITRSKRELMIRIGQDFRLTPDEIDSLIKNVFEN